MAAIKGPDGLPVRQFKTQAEWEAWLNKNHARAEGVWVRFAKKGSGLKSMTYGEAVEGALCYGWIDGISKGLDEKTYLQRFTPRRARSVWSKINREKALALIESGRMQPAGLREVERAQQDGRWDAAYDPPSVAAVPADLQAALDANAQAKAFFAALSAQNRYALLYRLHQAKKPETRARRIEQFIQMLEKKETFYPQAQATRKARRPAPEG